MSFTTRASLQENVKVASEHLLHYTRQTKRTTHTNTHTEAHTHTHTDDHLYMYSPILKSTVKPILAT